MLLNRKRINRLTRWGAIILAVTFALGTVFLGVGSKTGNLFAGCTNKTSQITASSSFEDREAFYLDLINQNPQDKDSMLQLANLYADDTVARYNDAVTWLNNYLQLDPKNNDVRLRIARIYMDKVRNNEAAVKVLNEVTSADPNNANAFLLLGQAAKAGGQNQTAILAWSRFLELQPNSEFATLIKDEIAKLSAEPAVAPPSTTATVPVPAAPGAPLPAAP